MDQTNVCTTGTICEKIQEFGEGSLMVWGRINVKGKTDLAIGKKVRTQRIFQNIEKLLIALSE